MQLDLDLDLDSLPCGPAPSAAKQAAATAYQQAADAFTLAYEGFRLACSNYDSDYAAYVSALRTLDECDREVHRAFLAYCDAV